MADTKISALTAVVSVAGANEFAVNEAGTSKKASATQLSTFVNANISLGAALNVNSQQLTSTAGTDIELHSDNDLNIILGDAAGVDDLNIKDSANAVVASINSDGAITAVSYGGITEANLLDKSAVETVSGAWTFSDQITVDNLNVNLNTISATSGAINITPFAGSAIILDGTINVDAGVVTGATSITSTAFVGDVTGNCTGTAATVTGATQAAITTCSNLVTVGALASGSIAVGFGAIDNGTNNITTGGILKVDVDGTAINAAGSFTYGAGNDVGIYWDGDENYIHQTTALTNTITYNTLKHDTSGAPANGIGVGLQFEQETAAGNNEKIAAIFAEVTDVTALAEDAELNINLMIAGAAHSTTATFDLNGLNLASGDGYSIAGTSVLNATTLGSGVTASSLTSVGTIATGTWSATTIAVDKGGTGQTTYTNGQLLIGNTTGNTLAKATLTQGTGMSITNGTGTITLAVADNYLLNTGDVGTGVYDFGGATSFEVPNGAGGTTVDATGELTIDSTSGTLNFYDGTAERTLTPFLSKSIMVESPTATEDLSFFFTKDAITISEMRAVLVGSATPSVTWTIRHGTDRSAAGAEVVTGGTVTTSTTTGSDVTTFNDATVVADSHVWLETTAQSGTVNSIIITVVYRTDP